MKTSKDDIRPKGTVEVPCTGADCQGEWWFWVDCLDPRLPLGPFTCSGCQFFEAKEQAKGQKLKRYTHTYRAFPGSDDSFWHHWEFLDGEIVHYPGEAARVWRESFDIKDSDIISGLLKWREDT